MTLNLLLDKLAVEVTKKDIRTLRLSVHPPDGRIKVSAPALMPLEAIRVFVLARLGWIRKQQQKLATREYAAAQAYIDGESHFFAGQRYVLKVVEHLAPASVELRRGLLLMRVRPGADAERRRSLLNEWYRQHLKAVVPGLIAGYQSQMGVRVHEFGIKRMKTRWGTCNPRARRIWLNLELARQPPECLEYIVVHEMVHLLERGHTARFYAFMDSFMPEWRVHKDTLNRLPVPQ